MENSIEKKLEFVEDFFKGSSNFCLENYSAFIDIDKVDEKGNTISFNTNPAMRFKKKLEVYDKSSLPIAEEIVKKYQETYKTELKISKKY